MLQKCSLFFLILCLTFTARAQNIEYNNSSDIFLQLKKLKVLGSVLYIAAHPDDENNGLLPWLAKEKLYRTGYLSLTRGDGGQNLIGSEQGVELGLIRTQELLAARRVDGAEQYFSTAYEFGFSKSAEESLKIWGHDKILSDVVWVIRKYQPDVIITRFPGDKRAGHGHHAASSLLANEAFSAAGDANKFPEQFKYGVKPWQAKRILWNTFNFGNTNTTSEDQLKYDVGNYNPLLGKSYGEIGGEARSMHKSQGEGRPRRKGPITEYFSTTGGDAPKGDLMDGIDQSWNRIAGGSKIEGMINSIINSFKLDQPQLSVPALVEVYNSIISIPESKWKQIKLKETQKLVEACASIFADATTTVPTVVQGESFSVNLFINNRKGANVKLTNVHFEGFDTTISSNLVSNLNVSFNENLHVADDKKISQPYWLEYPQKEGSFDVRDQNLIGAAENAPAYEVSYKLNIEGSDFTIVRPIQFKTVDPVKGELYEPLVILPKSEVNFVHTNYLVTDKKSPSATIHFLSNSASPRDHEIYVHNINNDGKNGIKAVDIMSLNKENKLSTITLPISHDRNNIKETFIAEVKMSGRSYDQYRRVISYDHIPTITYFAKAQANVVQVDLIKRSKNVGYIVGAGDKVVEELQQMGYNVSIITEINLTDDQLKNFDAIVVGIRAYNIYDYLTDKNEVLNRYVQHGGNLIIQYLKSNVTADKKIAAGPYPFTINGSTRVTEENASVNFLLPAHPVLHYPNLITSKDFEGWIQERSTYQAVSADAHFEMPLGMHDKDETETNGSLLIAKYGKGNVVYLSLVLFRELPAGVPGAYRLLANCIDLEKNNVIKEYK